MNAKGHVTIEVSMDYDCGQGWDDECNLAQIKKQAMRSAEQAFRIVAGAALKERIKFGSANFTNIRVDFGDPRT